MKKLIYSLLLIFGATLVHAQKISVNQMDQKVNKITRPGAAVYIELDEKDVKNLWKKRFKDFGKVSTSGGDYFIEAGTVTGINSTVRTISRVETSGKGTMVWMAIDMGDEWCQKGGKGWSSLEKVLYDFAVEALKEDIMNQISDAEKALDKTVKDQDKTMKEGENLQSDHQKNGENKIKLEQELKDNAAQKVQLEKDIEQNKKDQQRMVSEVDKMKKAVDIVKQKLHDVH